MLELLMDNQPEKMSRRGFLKVLSLGGASLLIPKRIIPDEGKNLPGEYLWPHLTVEMLPEGEVKEVLQQIPNIVINSEGYLTSNGVRAPFAETDWSRENRRAINPDALVVHWSAHPNPEETTVSGLLYGYNEVRTSRDGSYEFITSAHATIGPYSLEQEASSEPDSHISILQTQAPRQGALTISSHLRSNLAPEHEAYINTVHPIDSMQVLFPFYGLSRTYNYLPNVLRGSGEDLNLRTVSLELVGQNFDSQEGHPNPQLIANTAGVIFAYMNKYPEIRFSNINGHFEIQIDKADPGKRFIAELRLLLALKVLIGENQTLKENFFGPFMTESGNLKEAAKRFFDFHWDYLVSSYWGNSKRVFEWESRTGFWNIYKTLFEEAPAQIADHFTLPVSSQGQEEIVYGNRFTEPEAHEGIDLNLQTSRRLIDEDLGHIIASTANGKVIFAGEIPGRPGLGKTIVIEHILPDGAKVLSLYAHLDQIGVSKGQVVRINENIASMGNSGGQVDSHLHFALFPASAKREKELNLYLQLSYQGEDVTPYFEDESGRIYIVPATAGRQFVESHYFEPLDFISEHN